MKGDAIADAPDTGIALGIEPRAAALMARATPAQCEAIDAAVARLTGEEAMGRLFKVLELRGSGW